MARSLRAACLWFSLVPCSATLAQVPVFELATLGAPGAQINERLGDSLAMDASHLVAGLPQRSTATTGGGAVCVWVRQGIGFVNPTLLLPPTPVSSAQFGVSVALDGLRIATGELSSGHFGTPLRGAVHVFDKQAGVFTATAAIQNPLQTVGNQFGAAVAVEGDRIAIGAPTEFQNFQTWGAVYLFQRVGGQWQQEARLLASDGSNSSRFGASVAMSGTRLAIGAPGKMVGGVQEGGAYTFELSGGVWTETGNFSIAPASNDRALGVSIAIDGGTVIAGATRTNDRGAAYVFIDQGASWALQQRLQPSDLSATATFGQSVAVLGNSAVVGAWQDAPSGANSGSASVFLRQAGAWSRRSRLLASDPQGEWLGRSVGLDGAGLYAVGEPFEVMVGNPSASGAIQLYSPAPSIGVSYCPAIANSTLRTGSIAALGSAVALDRAVELVAYFLPNNTFGFFLTSRLQAQINQPGGSQGVLCLGAGTGRYVGPGQIRNSGLLGSFSLSLDLTMTPSPTGFVTVLAGQTWNFQAWHRDSLPGGTATSNFTNAVSVPFL
jgi:hypothetical protein